MKELGPIQRNSVWKYRTAVGYLQLDAGGVTIPNEDNRRRVN